MAIIAAASIACSSSDSVTFSWSGVTNADTCSAIEVVQGFTHKCMQVSGAPDSATAVIQGSNDGTNFFTLNDLQGSALSFTAAGLKGIAEAVRYIRPSTSGGGSSQSLDFHIHMTK